MSRKAATLTELISARVGRVLCLALAVQPPYSKATVRLFPLCLASLRPSAEV